MAAPGWHDWPGASGTVSATIRSVAQEVTTHCAALCNAITLRIDSSVTLSGLQPLPLRSFARASTPHFITSSGSRVVYPTAVSWLEPQLLDAMHVGKPSTPQAGMLAVSHTNHRTYRRTRPWRARWSFASAKRSGCRCFAVQPRCSRDDVHLDGATPSISLHAVVTCDNFTVANAAADPSWWQSRRMAQNSQTC